MVSASKNSSQSVQPGRQHLSLALSTELPGDQRSHHFTHRGQHRDWERFGVAVGLPAMSRMVKPSLSLSRVPLH